MPLTFTVIKLQTLSLPKFDRRKELRETEMSGLMCQYLLTNMSVNEWKPKV